MIPPVSTNISPMNYAILLKLASCEESGYATGLVKSELVGVDAFMRIVSWKWSLALVARNIFTPANK